MITSSNPVEIINQLKAIVGSQNYIEDTSQMESYLNDARGLFHGMSPLILKPLNSEMVSAIVTLCNEASIGIVPQGGNTGLVGGSVPSKSGLEVVISFWIKRDRYGAAFAGLQDGFICNWSSTSTTSLKFL